MAGGSEAANAMRAATAMQTIPAPNGQRISGERRVEGDERVRCMRVLGGLAVDVLAVCDPYDENEKFIVCDGVQNSVPPHTDAITVARSSKLLAPNWPRLVREGENARNDALPVFLLVNGLDLLGRGRLDQDPIACHAA